VSEDILYEYEEILQQHSAKGVAEMMMELFIESPNVVYQQIFYSWNAVKQDADDNKFFDIAVAGNADYLVTDDAHFKSIEKSLFPKVEIIASHEFLDICVK
jgi:predicted nucleic acid-binding protein